MEKQKLAEMFSALHGFLDVLEHDCKQKDKKIRDDSLKLTYVLFGVISATLHNVVQAKEGCQDANIGYH